MIFKNCITQIDPQDHQELTNHGNVLLPVACYDDDLNTYPVHWHWHDELEATVVLEGAMLVSVGARQFIVTAGDGLFINTGALHEAHPADPSGRTGCKLHALVFHPRLIGGNAGSVFWQKYLLPVIENPLFELLLLSHHDSWGADRIANILTAWNAAESELAGYEFVIRSELSDLIFGIYTRMPAQNLTLSPKILRENERMKLMLQYIHKNFSCDLTMEKIAQSASVSKSECLRCFKNIARTTPIQYVKQYRLQKAAELLTSSDMKITDIGTACGFQEMSYFSRAFREMWGYVPSKYRLTFSRRL